MSRMAKMSLIKLATPTKARRIHFLYIAFHLDARAHASINKYLSGTDHHLRPFKVFLHIRVDVLSCNAAALNCGIVSQEDLIKQD